MTMTVAASRAPAVLTPGDVAKLFKIDAKTAARWGRPKSDGRPARLHSIRTPGGHRRFYRLQVEALLDPGSSAKWLLWLELAESLDLDPGVRPTP